MLKCLILLAYLLSCGACSTLRPTQQQERIPILDDMCKRAQRERALFIEGASFLVNITDDTIRFIPTHIDDLTDILADFSYELPICHIQQGYARFFLLRSNGSIDCDTASLSNYFTASGVEAARRRNDYDPSELKPGCPPPAPTGFCATEFVYALSNNTFCFAYKTTAWKSNFLGRGWHIP